MLKIKVNLDKKTYDKLLSDITMFRIVKSNSTINKNKFMNLLFENYYEEYQKELDDLSNSIKDILVKNDIYDNDISLDIAMRLDEYKHPSILTYYSESLTFYLNDDNEFKLDTLKIISSISYSSYFRKLIIKYLELPQYKREEIIYRNIVEKINNAISLNRMINIKLDNMTYILRPYKIGTSKEEIYSYLLAMNGESPISIHILKIKSIVMLDNYKFSEEEKELLDKIYKLGIQYPFKKICKAKIYLNEEGQRLFNIKYLNRPDPIKIEDNNYYFECSYTQLLIYFTSFGNTMTIKRPDYLAKAVYNSYKGYVDRYDNFMQKKKATEQNA